MNKFNLNKELNKAEANGPCYLSFSIETSGQVRGIKVQIDSVDTDTLWESITEYIESMGYSVTESSKGAVHSFVLQLNKADDIQIAEEESYSRYK